MARAPTQVLIRSMEVREWPEIDQRNWALACRNGGRLSRGGPASHLKQVTRDDLACRYGLFLDFLNRSRLLRDQGGSAHLITPKNVAAYLAEITARVSSVSVHGAIAKLRRMGELLVPGWDGRWLRDTEQELAWEMRPAPKQHRIVETHRIVQAGKKLMTQAEEGSRLTTVGRARIFRNGLMIALLAVCPIRLKNFAALEIGTTIRKVGDSWLITLSSSDTKNKRADERRVPKSLSSLIDTYIAKYRRPNCQTAALWIGRNGEPLTYLGVERVLTECARSALGVAISPHLFRSSAASTAYRYAPEQPGLAAAILQHTDSRVTEKYYNRALSVSFSQEFLGMIERDTDC